MAARFMKILSIAGWTLFALDAVFVVMLFMARNVGDDAAGRGMVPGSGLFLLRSWLSLEWFCFLASGLVRGLE